MSSRGRAARGRVAVIVTLGIIPLAAYLPSLTERPAIILIGLVLCAAAALASVVRLSDLTCHTSADRTERQTRAAGQKADLYFAAIEALALAIDARSHAGPGHLRRVRHLAGELARAAGMTASEVDGVRTAALLRDIGKLAVPSHFLSKPGPLTPEEYGKVRIHPTVGASIMEGIPFDYPIARLIRDHHERWDGQGYPGGLKGEEIHPGARILAVADCFDALTSDRPYHRALPREAAVELLREEAGKALDPHLVSTFLDWLPRLEPAPASIPGSGATGQSSVFDDIALVHREIYALYDIAQAMGTGLGVADSMAPIATRLSRLVPFSCCALFVHDEDTDVLDCRFATGVDEGLVRQISARSGDGPIGWVVRTARPLVNAQPAADLEASGVDHATSLTSALICPLTFRERVIGVLSLYHTERDFYGDDHRRLLDRVCAQAGAVLGNSIVYEQTREDSLTDPLTGLPNTRSLLTSLPRELARAGRLHADVTLMVLDLDNFKDINDGYGHYAGDQALCAIAGVIRTAIRPYDICARYAGDEFVVVLPGCSRDEAERKRIELRQAVEETVFESKAGERVPLRVSVGAAVFPLDGRSYETLLARADDRMYRDKADRKRPDAPAGRTAWPEDDAAGDGEHLSDAELRHDATATA